MAFEYALAAALLWLLMAARLRAKRRASERLDYARLGVWAALWPLVAPVIVGCAVWGLIDA